MYQSFLLLDHNIQHSQFKGKEVESGSWFQGIQFMVDCSEAGYHGRRVRWSEASQLSVFGEQSRRTVPQEMVGGVRPGAQGHACVTHSDTPRSVLYKSLSWFPSQAS